MMNYVTNVGTEELGFRNYILSNTTAITRNSSFKTSHRSAHPQKFSAKNGEANHFSLLLLVLALHARSLRHCFYSPPPPS